ncbi:MAG: ABC transporter substrate-binding protein, partial [Halobacteriaceae archaeon]
PDASRTATERLINVEGVEGIIGPTSITISAVYDQFTQNQVPIVTPTAGTTSLDDRGGEYVFRTVASDSLGGRAIAKASRQKKYNSIKDFSRMALMVGNKEVFQSFKKPVKNSFTEFGGTITTEINFRTGKASYQSEVQTMMGSDPEITVLIGPNDDSVKIMEAAFQAGYQGHWFGTQDQTNEEFLAQSADKVTNGMLGLQAASYQPAVEAGAMDKFKQRIFEYAGWSELKIFATNSYDAMNIMGLAMKRAAANGNSVTGPNIAANIRPVAGPPGDTVTNYSDGASTIEGNSEIDYQGLVGPIDFDKDGDIVAPFKILKAKGKSWNEVARLPPEAL